MMQNSLVLLRRQVSWTAFLVCTALAGPYLSHAHADMYRWTDDQGVVHISDQPPPNGNERKDIKVLRVPDRGIEPALSVEQDRREVIVPFERAYGGMLVDVMLNDHLSARMLVDTGATTVKINVKLLRKLNQTLPSNPKRGRAMTAAGVVEAQEVFLDKVALGDAVKHRVRASITDEAHDYPNYDGLLGLSFLSDFRMTIDYEYNLIHLQKR